jgi:hypothetical protein
MSESAQPAVAVPPAPPVPHNEEDKSDEDTTDDEGSSAPPQQSSQTSIDLTSAFSGMGISDGGGGLVKEEHTFIDDDETSDDEGESAPPQQSSQASIGLTSAFNGVGISDGDVKKPEVFTCIGVSYKSPANKRYAYCYGPTQDKGGVFSSTEELYFKKWFVKRDKAVHFNHVKSLLFPGCQTGGAVLAAQHTAALPINKAARSFSSAMNAESKTQDKCVWCRVSKHSIQKKHTGTLGGCGAE